MSLFRRGMRSSRNPDPPPVLVPECSRPWGEVVRQIREELGADVATAPHHPSNSDIMRKLERIMHTLDETLDLVTSQKTRIAGLVALTTDLHQRVLNALGGNLTPSQQMRVDAIFDAVKSNADDVDAAITANTVDASKGAISDGPSASDIKANIAGSNTGATLGGNAAGSSDPGKQADAPGAQGSDAPIGSSA